MSKNEKGRVGLPPTLHLLLSTAHVKIEKGERKRRDEAFFTIPNLNF